MKGKVEVFAIASDGSERLILSEPNLVVDGAGQSIVDMLTCPSSVLTIAPQVVDTSNWRWGAISFGPAASSFQENAYFFPSNNIYWKTDDLCNGVSADVTSYINQISTDKILRPLWVSSTIPDSTASSYTPPYQLPSYPDPLDTKLEDASTAYSIVSGDGTQSFGQFENRIMWASGDASSYFQGAYPTSAGGRWYLDGHLQTSAMLVSSYEGDFSVNPLSHNVLVSSPQSVSADIAGGYNQYSSMDYRGYVQLIYNPPASLGTGYAWVSGSVNSANAVDMVVDPRVTMETIIFCSDLWGMNLYGGLHHIGLWSLDCKKSLETSTVPLFTAAGYVDTNGVTPREFRLFAKKTFTENLCQVKDSTIYSGFVYSSGTVLIGTAGTPFVIFDVVNLRIRWTLDFRSKHD